MERIILFRLRFIVPGLVSDNAGSLGQCPLYTRARGLTSLQQTRGFCSHRKYNNRCLIHHLSNRKCMWNWTFFPFFLTTYYSLQYGYQTGVYCSYWIEHIIVLNRWSSFIPSPWIQFKLTGKHSIGENIEKVWQYLKRIPNTFNGDIGLYSKI